MCGGGWEGGAYGSPKRREKEKDRGETPRKLRPKLAARDESIMGSIYRVDIQQSMPRWSKRVELVSRIYSPRESTGSISAIVTFPR